jgi:hypothetical protein
MNIYTLVFSNNPKYRITRHVIFWVLWISYYAIVSALSWTPKYPFSKTIFWALAEVTISTPLDMVFCYSIIYFLLPRFLFKGKYISMLLLWLLFSIFFIISLRLFGMYIAPPIREWFGLPRPMLSENYLKFFFSWFGSINEEGCLAAAIKLGKMWYIKQQELDLIKSEKRKIEPEIQDSRMQPGFLISALNKVERLSYEKPTIIPGMIRKIKSLLLYVIYDNNQTKVRLEKELKLLEEYVELEKEASDGQLNINIKMMGNMKGERIAPFIILPLVENSFRQLSLLELSNKSIDLDLRLAEGQLYIIVAWSKPVDTSTLGNGGNAFLHSIGKRLNLLYPQSHELKVIIKPSQFVIHCRINLHGSVN